MSPRDRQGRFVREAQPEVFGAPDRDTGTVSVDVGRGQAVEVGVGEPFVNTLEELARAANYGGYYKVFLNGSEVVNPADAPESIESGMRIAITSYDKVGL